MGLRFAIAGAAVIALIGIFAAHNSNVRREAVQKERARVEKLAEKKNEKAQTARTLAADDPLRVLNKSCRDCGKSGSVQIMEGSHSLQK